MNGSQLKVLVCCDNLSGTHFIKNSIESIDDNFEFHFGTINSISLKNKSEFNVCLFWLKNSSDVKLLELINLEFYEFPIIAISEIEDFKPGNSFKLNPYFELLFKKDLNPIFLMKCILFSSERFKLRKQLKYSTDKYNDLFYNTPLPLIILDTAKEKVLRVNDEARKIFGFTEEEFIGFNFKKLKRIDNLSNSPIEISGPLNEGEVNYLGTFRFRNKEKELKYFDIFVKANSYIDLDLRLIMATDVTERVLFDQLLSKAIFEAQENERFELGAELHDNVCQVLATGQLSLDLLDGLVPEDNPFLKRGKEMFKVAIDEIRRLSHRLAPAFYDNSTLDYLLGGIKDSTENGPFKLQIKYSESLYEKEFSKHIQLNLYRILQEQIQNIRKHAKATNVLIHVELSNDDLMVIIKDDGIGFNSIINSKGIGMNNIKRRVDKLSGNIEVHSSPGMGCEMILNIPTEQILV